MNYKKSLKLILTSLFIVLSIHAAFAASEPCEIRVEPCSVLTIPVATDKPSIIEGITIKAGFDQNLLEATGATLNGGILENKGYDLLVNTENAGKITLVIYAKDDSVTGIGNIAFITFKVKCTLTTSSLITMEKISPATGGFNVNETICQSLKITQKSCISKIGDVNCDYIVDIADAILTLKTLAGICGCCIFTGADVNGDKRIGFEELLYILQDISSY